MVLDADGAADGAPAGAPSKPKQEPVKQQFSEGLSLEDARRRVEVLEQEKRREAQARSYAQLERDRVIDFWDVTKARLAAAEASLRRQSLEEEERQREHSVAIKVYRDRIKRLLLERADAEAALKAEAYAAVQRLRSELDAREAAGEAARREALHQCRLREAAADQAVAQCRADCEQELARQRAEVEAQAAAVHERYERLLSGAAAAAEARCVADVRAAEGQRDASVQALAAQQAEALREAREHYRATAQAQLDLVAALKGDVQAARQREASAEAEARALRKQLAALQAQAGTA